MILFIQFLGMLSSLNRLRFGNQGSPQKECAASGLTEGHSRPSATDSMYRNDLINSIYSKKPTVVPEMVAPSTQKSVSNKRIRLWEVPDNIHCSIVGTCASVQDLRKIAGKVGIEVSEQHADYEIHGHFVTETTKNSPFTRAFSKMLDNRYEGAVRKFGRTKSMPALAALWSDMRDRGQIAGAYWALMTHSHVPDSLRTIAFGEVHMLSHLAGASFRKKTVEAVILQDRLQEAEERTQKANKALQETIGERDAEIARLKDQVAELRAKVDTAPVVEPPSGSDRHARRSEKLSRALMSARVRAREAERTVETLQAKIWQSRTRPAETARVTADAPATSEAQPDIAIIAGMKVLYVGGRNGTLDRLRAVAAEYDADLRHHDGGLEDTPQRLDHILPSVDCVLCPVTCVSHDASIRAKRACQRLEKPFIPLKSASQACFREALETIALAQSSSLKGTA